MKARLFSSYGQGIAFVFLYVAILYSTLPLTPKVITFIASKNMLRITIGFIGTLVAGAIFTAGWRSGRLKTPAFWLACGWICMMYFIASRFSTVLAERMHLWLYAGLGFFLFSALRFRFKGESLFALVAITATAFGCIDEGIQRLLPNRQFSFDDIVLNVLGSLTSLVIIRFVLGDEGE